MVDLSHWDFAEVFTEYEAAALILGIEPRGYTDNDEEARMSVVRDRLEQSYNNAADCVRHNKLFETKVEMPPEYLRSTQHDHGLCQGAIGNDTFARKELARWLRAVNLTPVYQFEREQAKPSGRWPWGDHHTEALGHLEAAAKRFWVNYDPTDNTTAPTNQDVSEWLRSERGLSRTMADAMASILRPDGLPTGPRK